MINTKSIRMQIELMEQIDNHEDLIYICKNLLNFIDDLNERIVELEKKIDTINRCQKILFDDRV